MIDKRFVVENYSVRDMSIDEKYVNSSYHIGDKGIAQSLCDLLNELYEENKKLLRRNGAMEEEIECLSDENGQLKAQLKQSVFVNLDGEDLSWAINRLCEFHQYPVGTDMERRAMEIILKELGKENPCKDTFYK